MKRLLLFALIAALFLPAIAQNQDEFKFSLVPRRVAMPVMTGYVTVDGLTPLTANWDVGTFTLTALRFVSDQATGTAPFTVASTTAVTNLNADLLDGNHAAAFAAAFAGRAVGDLIYANAATTVTGLPAVAAGQVLVSAGATTAPAWSASPSVTNYLAAGGSTSVPMLASATNPDSGFYILSDVNPSLVVDGSRRFTVSAASATFLVPLVNYNTTGTPIVYGTAEQQMGEDAAGPTDQTFKAADGFGTDRVGAMMTVQGGYSTGTGMGGGVRIQTSTNSTTGTTANTYYTRYRAVGKIVTLTDASATDVVSFAVVAGGVVGGMLVYTIDVTDDDASDRQVESGTVIFCGLQDEANWHTNISEVSTQALESGALATTWAIDTATANTLKITCNADSDLTTPVIKLRYQLYLNSPIVETP